MKDYLRHACSTGMSVLGFKGTRCPLCQQIIGEASNQDTKP